MKALDDSTDLRGKKIVRRTRAQVYRLWLAALRSGAYKQTQRKLKDGDGFCCLGVLCDLASKDGGPEWDIRDDKRALFMYDGSRLPPVMRDYLGMTVWDEESLMVSNDAGESFQMIATRIERNIRPRALGRTKKAAAPLPKERRSQVK